MTNIIPLELLALTIFASFIALFGGVLFLYTKRLSAVLDTYGVPFAAGTMIVTALLGLLPEAMHAVGNASLVVFTFSFLAVFVIEKLLLQLHHHNHPEHGHTKKFVRSTVPIVLFGDTIHNFIDGVAIAVAYAINPGLAAFTALSTFLHEVPHEIGDFSILLKAGFSKSRVLVINVLSALTTVLGAVLVSYVSPSEFVIGNLLAMTAGIFFYLGVIDFLPHAFDAEHNPSFVSKLAGASAVLLGAVIMTFSLMAVPHGHEYGHSADELHAEESEGHQEGAEEDGHVDEAEHQEEDEHADDLDVNP